jgi:hypothetical protein
MLPVIYLPVLCKNYKTVYLDLAKTFDKLKIDFSSTLEKTLKLWKK